MSGRDPKVRVNVPLDPDVYREAKARPEFNLSGFVNPTLRSYLFVTDTTAEDAVLRVRLHLAEERLAFLREAAAEAEAEVDRLAAIRDRREESKTNVDELWRQAREALSHPVHGYDHLKIGNPAVETWADKLGVTQTALLRELGVEVTADVTPPATEAATDGGHDRDPPPGGRRSCPSTSTPPVPGPGGPGRWPLSGLLARPCLSNIDTSAPDGAERSPTPWGEGHEPRARRPGPGPRGHAGPVGRRH